jgi:hypothetical protein
MGVKEEVEEVKEKKGRIGFHTEDRECHREHREEGRTSRPPA